MIHAYINYPNPHVTIHNDAQYGLVRMHGRPNQRRVRLDLSTLTAGLQTLVTMSFAAQASLNDVWVEVELDDVVFEREVIAFAVRRLGQRYAPLRGLPLQTHCCEPQASNETLRSRLIEIARRGETTTYQPLADTLGLNLDLQIDRAKIGRILGEISRHEHQQGRPLLSAVVVQSGSNIPGKGFFELARELGVHTSRDDLAFFATHLRAVHDYWRSATPTG